MLSDVAVLRRRCKSVLLSRRIVLVRLRLLIDVLRRLLLMRVVLWRSIFAILVTSRLSLRGLALCEAFVNLHQIRDYAMPKALSLAGMREQWIERRWLRNTLARRSVLSLLI